MGMYRPGVRRLWSETRDIVRAALVIMALTMSALFLFKQQDVSRLFLALLFVSLPFITIAGRVAIHAAIETILRRRHYSRAMLVASSGRLAREVAHTVARHSQRLTDRRSFGWAFTVAYLAILAMLLFIGRDHIFGPPLHEVGDLAANSLQVVRAKEFMEIHGNYSRFEFHHPGPALFYVYALGEIAFHDLLRITSAPHNAHLLAAAVVQSAFLAGGIATVARFAAPNRGLFIALAIGIALVHFGLADHPEFSVWPPNALVFPFAGFLLVAIGLATGWTGLLPVLIVYGGFLVHGHVAQPLFVVPLSVIAYGIGMYQASRARRHSHERGVGHPRTHVLALAVLSIFLVPIVIDALRGPTSNLAVILETLVSPRSPEDVHSPVQVAGYILAFLGYPTTLGELDFTVATLAEFVGSRWIVFLGVFVGVGVSPIAGWLALDRTRRLAIKTPLLVMGVVLVTALCLTALWVAWTKGPLFQFNSLFIYGLVYAALLPAAVLACHRWPPRLAQQATALLVVVIAAVAVQTRSPTLIGESPLGTDLAARTTAFATDSAPNEILLEFEGEHWPVAASVALALERSHVSWYVHPNWRVIFGPDRLYVADPDSEPPTVWHLTPPDDSHEGQIVLSPAIAIYPPPP